MSAAPPFPMAMLAELTHRCPLQCPYCSNPLELERRGAELTTEEWRAIFSDAAELGVLQVHLSGGEPTARGDLVEIVAHCREVGIYTNLITAGVLLDEAKLGALVEAGLDHLQLSFDDVEAENGDRIAGFKAHEKRLEVARATRAAGLPLTVNAVIHRHNAHNVAAIIEMALDLNAHRLEVASVQYYGWALRNRAALMPSRAQTDAIIETVLAARERLMGRLVIDYVVPDYYAKYPKPCMGGWGRMALNVTPSGKVLPCHAAEAITNLEFDKTPEKGLREIWENSSAFNAFRGTDWMGEPCRSCPRKAQDFGGCRCQAFALLGDAGATDPACSLSPHHRRIEETAREEAAAEPPDFIYRRIGG